MAELKWAPRLVSQAESLAEEYPEIDVYALALKEELESGRLRRLRILGEDIDVIFKWQGTDTTTNTMRERDHYLVIIRLNVNVCYIVDVCQGNDCNDYKLRSMRGLLRSLRIDTI